MDVDKMKGAWRVTNGQPVIARIGVDPESMSKEEKEIFIKVLDNYIDDE